ncbi:MAG: hypothetical protein AB7G87_12650 [Clostridia bacterium]
MAETESIARAAEIMANEIFPYFGWTECGSRNQNWNCVDKDHHKRKTHPSDIVFCYLEPYSNFRTYINCDLKSYKCSTIINTQFENVLNSLGVTTKCANISPGWNELYNINDQYSRNVYGLLFIYNHDCSYDKDFFERVRTIREKIIVPKGVKLFIFSPQDVVQLYTISTDIMKLIADGKLPQDKDYSFHYPDLDGRKKIGSTWKKSATIEMLSGPWIIIQTKPKPESGKINFYIYYRNEGSTSEEFVYLIDYLFKYQLIADEYDVQIRGVETARNCATNFQKAKQEYCSRYHLGDATSSRVEKITFKSVTRYIASFDAGEIGMEVR